tara:strand:- start:465 stop:731 length:267 start_codon:yes stop_codon:yes gene_type:complete
MLDVLMSDTAKQQGLKRYPQLDNNKGVIFVYDRDDMSKYDFSEIGYKCRILFLDSNFKTIHQAKTTSHQKELVSCPESFRYVIEVGEK